MDPRAVAPLIKALKSRESGDDTTVVNALSGLCRHDQKSVLEGLESPDPGIRTGSAAALASTGDQESVPSLLCRAAGAAAGGLTVFFLWGVGVWVGVLSHYNPLITLASVVAVVILGKAAGPLAGMGILAGVAGHGAAYGVVRLMRLAYLGSGGTKD
jgi:hypothetical protein